MKKSEEGWKENSHVYFMVVLEYAGGSDLI
jgi:hypothetical protein